MIRNLFPNQNDHFMNMYRNVDTVVTFLQENLIEKSELKLEIKNLGYGISIEDFRDSKVGVSSNCTWGGEGASKRNSKNHI